MTLEDSGDLQSMESSADRFFKGFSLEDYRLQALVNRLEKEKKQCLNRLKEETHVFKMSARLPVKRGEEYWSQYGENFHANGDKREKASVIHLSAEHNKEDLNSISTVHQDNTINSKHRRGRSMVIPPHSPQHRSGNRNVQRNSFQQIRSRSNRKNDSSKKPRASGLTLLEILCGDFEHGVILLKKTDKQNDSRFGEASNDLRHHSDKQSKKAHQEGRREKPLPSDICKSLKSQGMKESFIRSRTSEENRLEVAQSEVGDTNSGSRSKSDSFEALNSDCTLNGTWGLNSQESVPLWDGSAQKLNWTSSDSVNSFILDEVEKNLQSPASQSHEWNSSKQTHGKIELLAAENVERSSSLNEKEESVSCYDACLTSSLEAQAWEHQCRFVHFREGHKLTRKKGNKQNSGVDINDEKEKLNRTKSPDVQLFQVDVPRTSQRRKSQEEIDRETRQKMDQFFAKVEHTKNFQPGKLRWRCSSGSERGANRSEWKSSLEAGKRPHAVKMQGYRRAQPWPTQVWS